jgi:hypothetical protein
MYFAKAILAFATAALLLATALGDSLTETRCWCANEDRVGLVYTVNFTSTKYNRDYNYVVKYTSLREDTNKNVLGIRCDNGTCHDIPKVEKYKVHGNALNQNRQYGRCHDFEDGRTVCTTPSYLWTDDESWHWKYNDDEMHQETIMDCAQTCKTSWRQDEQAYDLCTYENRRKGEHYGKIVPAGQEMDKKGNLSNRKNGGDQLWASVSCDSHTLSELKRRGFIDGH